MLAACCWRLLAWAGPPSTTKTCTAATISRQLLASHISTIPTIYLQHLYTEVIASSWWLGELIAGIHFGDGRSGFLQSFLPTTWPKLQLARTVDCSFSVQPQYITSLLQFKWISFQEDKPGWGVPRRLFWNPGRSGQKIRDGLPDVRLRGHAGRAQADDRQECLMIDDQADDRQDWIVAWYTV